ncbi:MAG: Ig-like domain-containing protein [Pseudomonadota bacterium]
MRFPQPKQLSRAIALAVAMGASAFAGAGEVDHREFDATVYVPFRAAQDGEARTMSLHFSYPLVERAQLISWRLELVDQAGSVVQRWYGIESLQKEDVKLNIDWNGRGDAGALADGIYTVRLSATANDADSLAKPSGVVNDFVEATLAANSADVIEQSWDLQVGQVEAPAMPAFHALNTVSHRSTSVDANGQTVVSQSGSRGKASAATLPYTIYYGNLHSQTNHSDGGGALSSCSGAQNPQSAAFGPTDAYNYAMNKGLDILMTSEHNHMFDGSDNTNTAATPAFAKNLYASGLAAAASFNAAHPNFLAVYGMEWGVINNGGHMNIFNSNELFGWEYNSSNQLLADVFTTKNDYAALYTLMAQKGLVGQFNHPSSSGQYLVNNVALGYTADGEKAMALCEVSNTSAFSVNTTETETSRSSYEGACKKALEAGFKVAFSTDQDNHCANWGASYTNRTGILVPNGTALSSTSFIDAVKARRVFATLDKNSQLVMTANGHLMGESFTNAGPLNLVANYTNSAGRSAATVEFFEGVPKRNGFITSLATAASTTITPTIGEHLYYVKVTQDDGKLLWSAPVWVTQVADTVAPSVSVGESGSSGNITLSATASDNVGVARVEFYVDGTLKGSSTTSPYQLVLDSKTLSNATHTLTAKAYDAANNIGSAAPLNFSVNNIAPDTVAPSVSASATGSSGTIKLGADASDNVGVSAVEFYVDAVLQGGTSVTPYAMSLDSHQLANGSHALFAKAYDAAHNVGTSGTVSFTVFNAVDVSAQTGYTVSGLVFNRSTNTFSGAITVTNRGASALAGPVAIQFNNLPAGVTLSNASGTHAGAPFVSTGALAAGASVTLPLVLINPAKVSLSYGVQIYSGPF